MTDKDLIIVNAKVTALDRQNPAAEAVAIRDGRFLVVGSEAEARVAAPDAAVSPHAGAAVGSRCRRFHRAPVRRETPTDNRRIECRRARHPGFHPSPLRPRPAERRRAARGLLYQGYAEPSGRRDRA